MKVRTTHVGLLVSWRAARGMETVSAGISKTPCDLQWTALPYKSGVTLQDIAIVSKLASSAFAACQCGKSCKSGKT